MTELPLIARAEMQRLRVAFRIPGVEQTYGQLLDRSAHFAAALLDGGANLREARVALAVPAGLDYAAALWGTWRAGGIAVPLSLSATVPEWEYVLRDAQAATLVVSAPLADTKREIGEIGEAVGCRVLRMDGPHMEGASVIASPPASSASAAEARPHAGQPPRLPHVGTSRGALLLYTSGTTSQPKGVLATHANIQAQIESLVAAWEWQAADCIPLFLPLHHIHGIVNVLCCALWSGAAVEPFARFDPPAILDRVRADAYTLFMAVPTIYVKLIEALRAAPADERDAALAGFRRLRLMVSGSAALPASVHEEWLRLTGQPLLERYGMTEIGMGLSNPYRGERRAGTVGQPLPGVEVRLKTEAGELVAAQGQAGEIQVRGPGIFREYWNRPAATSEAFDDGWFRTGDVAVVERGYYRILGRQSVDIIKSGGYKLSALEIEAALLDHPAIGECAVVGVPDDTWGEAVAAAVVLAAGAALDLESLRDWCRARLSAYKIPQRLRVVAGLPRNAMGKVTKPAVRALFSPERDEAGG